MLNVIFSLDYEIHGNGEGCSRALMTEPTERLLRLFEEYGAKLTIMADIGEILKFKEYAEERKRDDYHYGAIVSQLQAAVARGHDVQLHIHSSYFNATHDGRQWVQDWGEYDFAGLGLDRMRMMVTKGKEFLESILKPVNSAYRCIAFRAANWSVSPSTNVVTALADNGLEIDTSIFKYGRRDGIVNFDYSRAYSNLVPWRASQEDLCVRDDRGKIWEFPIYSENRWIGAFLTPNRVLRVARSPDAVHLVKTEATRLPKLAAGRMLLNRLMFPAKRHAWKADFNQCTGRQMVGALRRAERQAPVVSDDIPFVLIGHSKLFNPLNERSLRPFLAFVAQHRERFRFETFASFHARMAPQTFPAGEDMPGAPPGVSARPTQRSYVLVTSAWNEESTIESTIQSVISQTIPPKEWIIVSDRSTDQTDEIVKKYAATHDFIRLLRIDGPAEHSFIALVRAKEAGLKALQAKGCAYVGLLDADVRFGPDYYEKLMTEFESNPALGMAGGMVVDVGPSAQKPHLNVNEIAGATQLFSRACFDSLENLLPMPDGGWDVITCVRARMKGFRTATFPSLVMDHLKPRNASQGNWWKRNWQHGIRDYMLGSHPVFEVVKCLRRAFDPPLIASAIARLLGYLRAMLNRSDRPISSEITNHIRQEQLRRLGRVIRWRQLG